MTYTAPSIDRKSFTCPHCGVLSRHYHWGYAPDRNANPIVEHSFTQPNFRTAAKIRVSICEHCNQNCLWWEATLVYPNRGQAPPPNPDTPPDVLADYEEAARISVQSPRGAAALLRLAVQKLMPHLNLPGKNLNEDIGALVARGLPPLIQQALDAVRVIGNNAVHPGVIDASDVGVAERLFPLLNLIVESQISVPRQVAALYSTLPDGQKQQIVRRDQDV